MTINKRYFNTLFSGIIFTILSTATAADDFVSREYKIKAAYLYNLTKFVSWPQKTNSIALSLPVTSSPPAPADTTTDSVNICIYGHSPFGKQLSGLQGRKVKGKPIKVNFIQPSQPTGHCHILFISNTVPDTKELLSSFADHPLLTVGEESSFLDHGGLIGLVIAGNRLQLQINLTAAKAHGFEISGNLLEIARVVK